MYNLKTMTVEELEQKQDEFQAKIDGPENNGRITANGSADLDLWMDTVASIEDELALRSLEQVKTGGGKIMKTILKTTLKALGWLGICLSCGYLGWLVPRPQANITEQLKSLQQQVGCTKVDAVIGPETTRLVNAAVKQEQWELFNSYAAVYYTPTGRPK